MFQTWVYNDGLGETKASVLARGCLKVRRGVFRCPDGSEIVPSDEVASGGGGSGSGPGGSGGGYTDGDPIHAPGETWCLDPCTRRPYPASDYDHTQGPGGGVCPRKVPASGCPPPAKGPTPAAGGGSSGGSASGGVPYGDDMLEPTAIGGGDSPLSFLTESVAGIPIWAIGIGTFLLLRGGRR